MENEKYLHLREEFGSPIFVYEEEKLRAAATEMLSFKVPFGLKIRYAMKANSNRSILQIFNSMGIHIDASSEYEVQRAMLAGIDPSKILLTAQLIPENMPETLATGIEYNATSLHQLEEYGKAAPGSEISIRINPGEGSSSHAKTLVAGPDAGFGIWYDSLHEAKSIISRYTLKVARIHTHIGSGTNPDEWAQVAQTSINLLKEFPEATILNLGGGFKVARMPHEKSTDISAVSTKISEILEKFYAETGRKINLELEPGTFLTANAGTILTTIQDVTRDVHTIIKLRGGMSEIIRPALYGAEHPLTVVAATARPEEYEEAIVIGHSCEHSDLLTTQAGNGDIVKPRRLLRAKIGDILLIGGAGAYCSSMATKNYISMPEAAEVLIDLNGKARLIRKRQTIEQMIQNELKT